MNATAPRQSPQQSRREFLANAPRLILLGALAALTARLTGQTESAVDPARHRCSGDRLCRHCPALDECLLPLAQSFRNHPRNPGMT